ncbi:uncharacterized protein BX664DRAFT_319014 [Halteromyces radiatus]|uniref:uncharacterized protein n=1 Tax=Halteromyces radiatus TaxID=101107 RepID=UPI0022203008|nr:uncharacterized protein BX664DRAFT_319014 [Halteromyces radiatus]KAI8098551.1 hypothetical protein BX664DRAFT_319014 [Halteromyces radiatus]
MKHLSLTLALGVLSSSMSVMARSSVYFTPMIQPMDSIPEVSLNTFSTWMAHMTGSSEIHSVFHWKDKHRQEALEGIQTLWSHPTFREMVSGDIFEPLTNSKKSMVIIDGVAHSKDILPNRQPSLYVDDNDAQDFMDVALDTMALYADKNAETQKIENVDDTVDTNLNEIIDSFKTHYESLVDTTVFDSNNKADRTFMIEMEKIRGMTNKDFNVVRLTGLKQLGQEHGINSNVYREAQQVVQQLINNDIEQQQKETMTLIMTPWTNTMEKRAVPEKINAVSDFQLLFWTGVFLVLVTSGVLTFVYRLGSVDTGNVVMTSTLPKQD